MKTQKRPLCGAAFFSASIGEAFFIWVPGQDAALSEEAASELLSPEAGSLSEAAELLSEEAPLSDSEEAELLSEAEALSEEAELLSEELLELGAICSSVIFSLAGV